MLIYGTHEKQKSDFTVVYSEQFNIFNLYTSSNDMIDRNTIIYKGIVKKQQYQHKSFFFFGQKCWNWQITLI